MRIPLGKEQNAMPRQPVCFSLSGSIRSGW
jgi:hypothetical protein